MNRITIIAFVCLVFCALGFRGFTQQQSCGFAATRLIADARERGVPVYADQYPYPTSGSDGQTVLIPMWALVYEGVDAGGQFGQVQRGGGEAFKRMRDNFARRFAIRSM